MAVSIVVEPRQLSGSWRVCVDTSGQVGALMVRYMRGETRVAVIESATVCLGRRSRVDTELTRERRAELEGRSCGEIVRRPLRHGRLDRQGAMGAGSASMDVRSTPRTAADDRE